MKILVLCLALMSSLTVSASIEVTQSEIEQVVDEYKYFSEEELGKIESTSCIAKGYRLDCIFIYDLPEQMCWYGHFEVKASYFRDHHGALVLHEGHSVEWKN